MCRQPTMHKEPNGDFILIGSEPRIMILEIKQVRARRVKPEKAQAAVPCLGRLHLHRSIIQAVTFPSLPTLHQGCSSFLSKTYSQTLQVLVLHFYFQIFSLGLISFFFFFSPVNSLLPWKLQPHCDFAGSLRFWGFCVWDICFILFKLAFLLTPIMLHPTYWGPSLVAQMVKRLPTMWETRVRSLGQKNPLGKEMATHSSTLAWKSSWAEEPGRLQSMGSQRVRHGWAISLAPTDFMCILETSSVLHCCT